jgi:hypothetical protein
VGLSEILYPNQVKNMSRLLKFGFKVENKLLSDKLLDSLLHIFKRMLWYWTHNLQGVSYWRMQSKSALRGRRINISFYLWCLVASGHLGICVLSINFHLLASAASDRKSIRYQCLQYKTIEKFTMKVGILDNTFVDRSGLKLHSFMLFNIKNGALR